MIYSGFLNLLTSESSSPSGRVNSFAYQERRVMSDGGLNQQAGVARRRCHKTRHSLTMVVKKCGIGIVMVSEMFKHDFWWHHRFLGNELTHAI
jgi:hypothetical protein